MTSEPVLEQVLSAPGLLVVRFPCPGGWLYVTNSINHLGMVAHQTACFVAGAPLSATEPSPKLDHGDLLIEDLRDEMRPKYGGRAANSCERAGLFTLRDVSALGRKRFGQRLGVGPGSLLCLDELLAAHGMRWSDAPALTRSDEGE